MDIGIAGSVALVTGARGGLGFTIANVLAAEGRESRNFARVTAIG
jgi:NAD(P)-dependent dehydrogenase (short-subunit alcohol dehydrogenase family)